MNSALFWRAPLSYWKTLSPREIPTEFSTLLEITTVLLEDQMNFLCSSGKHHNLAERLCLQERSQLNFLLFWRLPPSYWKTLSSGKIPNEFCTLLMSTTVLRGRLCFPQEVFVVFLCFQFLYLPVLLL